MRAGEGKTHTESNKKTWNEKEMGEKYNSTSATLLICSFFIFFLCRFEAVRANENLRHSCLLRLAQLATVAPAFSQATDRHALAICN
jgi:hypothetical protein